MFKPPRLFNEGLGFAGQRQPYILPIVFRVDLSGFDKRGFCKHYVIISFRSHKEWN